MLAADPRPGRPRQPGDGGEWAGTAGAAVLAIGPNAAYSHHIW